jgi:phospholipase/carboxylesterase
MQEIIIEPPQPAHSSIIWLHGLGADGHDFESIVSELPKSVTDATRFIFPHAPERRITINGSMVMRGWYDILGLDKTASQDAKGISEADKIICEFIEAEINKGISSEKIFLAGFSQGGAIALHTGLRYSQPLGGIIALSCYLPLNHTIENEIHAANRNIPIFMAHGIIDNVISLNYAELSRERLKKLNYNIEWHQYNMEHTVSLEEINDLSSFIDSNQMKI